MFELPRDIHQGIDGTLNENLITHRNHLKIFAPLQGPPDQLCGDPVVGVKLKWPRKENGPRPYSFNLIKHCPSGLVVNF